MSSPMLDLVRPEVRAMSAYQVPKPAGIEVKLDANESPYELPAELQEALAKELAQVSLNRYPDPRHTELRAVLAAEYEVAEEALIFGNGSDEIIQILVACLSRPRAGQSRSSILFPGPTFSVFRLLADVHGVASCCAPLLEDFTLDVPAVRKALQESQPNIAFFARPNNPTGTLWAGEDILQLAVEFPQTLFVSDEAYGEYATGSLVSSLPQHPNLMVMKTLSKIGLAGLRVGFAIADPALIAELNKARAPYNISALNQRAALWSLQHTRDLMRQRCAEVVGERARLSAALGATEGLRVFDSEANLILFRVGKAGAGQGPKLWARLCEQGVLIRNFGSEGPLADCLRVTIGTSLENDRFLAALASD